MLDILIKNGTVFDGTGSVSKIMDVGIEQGKVRDVAPTIASKALQTIDAKGLFVAPGFIDIQNHSDTYWTIFDHPDQTSLLSQGITSIVMGNCGASLAPLLSAESIKTIQKWHNLSGVNVNWASVEEFLQLMSQTQLGVNIATLVGHATLRRGLLGDEVKQLNAEDLKVLDRSLNDALDQGALGLSMGLVYAHEVNSSLEELSELTQLLKRQNKYLSVHLRSEGANILESLDEVLGLATASDVAVKISHLKIRGSDNWHLFEQMLSKLEIAYHQGLNVSFDVYPYSTTWTVLYTYLPKWAYEGGRTQILEAIADKMSRRKILDYLRHQNQDLGTIIIAEASGNSNFVGKTLKQIAANQSVSPEEALVNVIQASGAQAIVFDHNLSAEHVEILSFSPLSMIATDGAGYGHSASGLVHPRCYGTMPKFLRSVREKKLLKWEFAIKKLTSEPASFLGLKDRGTIVAGKHADVVIFDPLTILDKADYRHPNVLSEGIAHVLVNGKLAFSNQKVVNLNGQIIRR